MVIPETDASKAKRSTEEKGNADADLDGILGTVSRNEESREGGAGEGRGGSRRERPARKKMLHLGYDAGVKVNDVLLGIDDVTLQLGVEVSEVLSLLQGKGEYVTLHFRRRRHEAGHPRFHPVGFSLLEQNVVSEAR